MASAAGVADAVGWDNAHDVLYAGVLDQGVGPHWYSQYETACTYCRIALQGRDVELAKTNAKSLTRDEVQQTVATIIDTDEVTVTRHIGTLLEAGVPITGKIFAMNPATGKIEHEIPCHGNRAHGIAWDPYDGNLWCVDTNKRVIFKLNPDDCDIVDAVGCSVQEPHGMTIWQGQFWLCDATSPTARDVYVFDVPRP